MERINEAFGVMVMETHFVAKGDDSLTRKEARKVNDLSLLQVAMLLKKRKSCGIPRTGSDITHVVSVLQKQKFGSF